MSLHCGTMEKEGFLFLHRTKDKCMPMTSPFKKYYVTISKDTLSYSRTQPSKVSNSDALAFTQVWNRVFLCYRFRLEQMFLFIKCLECFIYLIYIKQDGVSICRRPRLSHCQRSGRWRRWRRSASAVPMSCRLSGVKPWASRRPCISTARYSNNHIEFTIE